MVERGSGRLKLVPVADAKAKILQPELEAHISKNVATIYSDGHPIYVFALNRKFAGKQKTIDRTKTYAIGDVHTNNIENAFGLFKRGLYGTFHKGSTKHLGRYCDEFSYRFNRRGQQPELFAQTTKALLNGERLTYNALTSPVSES